jgi:hypothetical protein
MTTSLSTYWAVVIVTGFGGCFTSSFIEDPYPFISRVDWLLWGRETSGSGTSKLLHEQQFIPIVPFTACILGRITQLLLVLQFFTIIPRTAGRLSMFNVITLVYGRGLSKD